MIIDGYFMITETKSVHREVYKNEVGPIPRGWHVHHINGLKQDNRVENLIAIPKCIHTYIHTNYPMNRLPERECILKLLDDHMTHGNRDKKQEKKKRKKKRKKKANAMLKNSAMKRALLNKSLVRGNT